MSSGSVSRSRESEAPSGETWREYFEEVVSSNEVGYPEGDACWDAEGGSEVAGLDMRKFLVVFVAIDLDKYVEEQVEVEALSTSEAEEKVRIEMCARHKFTAEVELELHTYLVADAILVVPPEEKYVSGV